MVPLHRVVPGAIFRLIASQPHSGGKVEAAWRLAVGAGLARMSHVRKDTRGTLLVDVDDPHVGRELEGHRPLIEQRLRAMLGEHAHSFRVTSDRRASSG